MDENKTSADLLQEALEAEQKKNAELAATNRAIVEEFNTAGTYGEQVEVAKKAVATILPDSLRIIHELILTGESEGVRASLSRWVADTVLSGKLDKSSQGEFAELYKKLLENDGEADSANPTKGELT